MSEFILLCRINNLNCSIIHLIINTYTPPHDMAKLFKFKLTKDENVLIHVDWKKLGALWTNADRVLMYYTTHTTYGKQNKFYICNLYAKGISSSGFNPALYDEFTDMCIKKLNVYITRNNKINDIFAYNQLSHCDCESRLLHTIRAFTYEAGYTYHANYTHILGLISSYKLISKCCDLYPSQMLSICVMLNLPLKGRYECTDNVEEFWEQLKYKIIDLYSINHLILKRFAKEYCNVFETINWEILGFIVKDQSVLEDVIFREDTSNLIRYNWKIHDNKYSKLGSSISNIPKTTSDTHPEDVSEHELKHVMITSIVEILQPIIVGDDVEKFMEIFESVEDKTSVLQQLMQTFTQSIPIQILHYLKILEYEINLHVFQDELLSLSPEKVEFLLSNNYVVVD